MEAFIFYIVLVFSFSFWLFYYWSGVSKTAQRFTTHCDFPSLASITPRFPSSHYAPKGCGGNVEAPRVIARIQSETIPQRLPILKHNDKPLTVSTNKELKIGELSTMTTMGILNRHPMPSFDSIILLGCRRLCGGDGSQSAWAQELDAQGELFSSLPTFCRGISDVQVTMPDSLISLPLRLSATTWSTWVRPARSA